MVQDYVTSMHLDVDIMIVFVWRGQGRAEWLVSGLACAEPN